jgi:hypothetical protein
MVFGRSPKVPSAVNLNQDTMKEHPRARAYLDSLQTSLSAIWQELDASGVIAYQQSFAKANKGRKPAMFVPGDYVMHSCTTSRARRRTMPQENYSYRGAAHGESNSACEAETLKCDTTLRAVFSVR